MYTNVYYPVQNGLPLDTILRQLNPVHIFIPHFYEASILILSSHTPPQVSQVISPLKNFQSLTRLSHVLPKLIAL
jgi:hypothetical protein